MSILRNFSLRNQGVFILILSVAFFLRIINISNNPPALYGDELTMVLDVNSILNTGFDTTGKFLPLNFTMGGGRPVGYGYFSIPFVAIFGTSALGIRLLSVLSGVEIVFLIYIFGKRLFSKQVGLIAAGLLAISPWDLSISRGGFETHFALFLALLGIVMFLKAKKRSWFYIVSALSFGLSINTYSTYKLTLPIFLPLLFWFSNLREGFFNKKNRIYLILSTSILLLFLSLLLFQAFLNKSEARFLSINIFTKQEIKSQITEGINERRNLNPLNEKFSKLLDNKIWEYGFLLGRNYLNSFSTSFLFLDGDRNPRHNMAGTGSFYIVELFSIFFGLGFLFRKNYLRKMIFLVSWILLAPIATSLISDPHALRSSFMLPPLVLLSATGLYYLWTLREKLLIKVVIFVCLFGFLIQFIFISENLYLISPNKYSRFWAYSARKAFEIAIQNKEKYNYVFLSDRIDAIEFAYPVYAEINPVKVLEQNKTQTQIGEYKFRRYDNVYIGYIPDSRVEGFMSSLEGSILYIGPAEDRKFLNKSELINGLDGLSALVLEKKEH